MLYLPINEYLGKKLYMSFKADSDIARLYFGLFDSNYDRVGFLQTSSLEIPGDTSANGTFVDQIVSDSFLTMINDIRVQG